MPRIARIDTAAYDVPLQGRLTWGSGHELRHLAHVLVRVELADGAAGIAEAPARPSIYGETQATIRHIIEQHLAPGAAGRGDRQFRCCRGFIGSGRAHQEQSYRQGRAGYGPAPGAGGQPGSAAVRHYLGATRRRIRLSSIVSTGSPAAVLADVRASYAAGLRVFKVKIGRDITAEIETIEHLLDEFPAARFYVDANETLAIDKAAALLDRLYELGVIHCEEALPVHELAARRQLRRDCRMPIIADDSAFTVDELRRELAFETFDILNIKTARTGFSQSRRMLEHCAAAGKDAMVGSQAGSLLGCLHAAIFAGHEAVTCANECSFYLKTQADLSFAPPIVEGWLALDDAEGALVRVQEALKDFA